MSRSLAARIHRANTVLLAHSNLEAVSEFFTSDYVAHFTGQDSPAGHRAVQNVLRAVHSAFSHVKVDVLILLEGEDRIAWQRTMTGTQTGAFKGFPATGQQITWRDMVVSQFMNDLIKEEWVSTDLAERLLLSRKS